MEKTIAIFSVNKHSTLKLEGQNYFSVADAKEHIKLFKAREQARKEVDEKFIGVSFHGDKKYFVKTISFNN